MCVNQHFENAVEHLPGWASDSTVGVGWKWVWVAPRLVAFWGEVKDLHLAKNKNIPQGYSPGRNHWWHTQKHHTKIRMTTKGDFEANIWTNVWRRFQNVGWHTFLFVFDTFIQVDWFGSSTENDTTGGTKLFGPTTDFLYGVRGIIPVLSRAS